MTNNGDFFEERKEDILKRRRNLTNVYVRNGAEMSKSVDLDKYFKFKSIVT